MTSPTPAPQLIETFYPSMAASGLGRALNGLYESIPARIGRIRISHLLFPLPTVPLAILGYALNKVLGEKYVFDTHGIQRRKLLTGSLIAEAPWDQVAGARLDETTRATFLRATDVVILGPNGQELLRLPAVPNAPQAVQLLEEIHRDHAAVKASLERIRGRGGIPGHSS